MRLVALVCLATLPALIGEAGPAVATPAATSSTQFPGPVSSVSSPTGDGRIFYAKQATDRGFPVYYEDRAGRRTRIATLVRSIAVRWAPDGSAAFLQDNYGSDASDCDVVSVDGHQIGKTSLLGVIRQSPGRPTGDEVPGRSHYYVQCQDWLADGAISGSVNGHTDTDPSHVFDHRFVYTLSDHRLRWSPP